MEEAEEEVETEVDDDGGHGVNVIPVKREERGKGLILNLSFKPLSNQKRF